MEEKRFSVDARPGQHIAQRFGVGVRFRLTPWGY